MSLSSLLRIGEAGQVASSTALTSAQPKLAMIGNIQDAGSIVAIHYYQSSVTTAQSVQLSFQVLSAGVPSGTVIQSGTFTPTVSTWFRVALGAAYTVTAGQTICVVMEWVSTQGSITVAYSSGDNSGLGYFQLYNGATWSKLNRTPILAFEYSDGSIAFVHDFMPSVLTTGAFNSSTVLGSGGGERGLLITPAVTFDLIGVDVDCTFGGTCDIVVYDSTGTTLATKTVTATEVMTATHNRIFLGTTVRLTAGQTYRVTLKPGATNNTLFYGDLSAASHRAAFVGGMTIAYTYRSSGSGTFTDLTTRLPMLALLGLPVSVQTARNSRQIGRGRNRL